MNILKLIFIDEAIATCFEQKCGIATSYTIGLIFRLAEFGVVSAIPPIILNNYSNKYNTIIAAITSFFGMKFFSRLIEVFSQDSMPVVMKNLRESNKRLEDSVQLLKTDIKNLKNDFEPNVIKNVSSNISKDIQNISKDIQNISKDIQNNFGRISYNAYDSPRNGD
jgi:gas vesicle protein